MAACGILGASVVIGFGLGRVTAPIETVVDTKIVTEKVPELVTITEQVEVPVYIETAPTTADVFIYDVPLSENLQRYIYEICKDEQVPITLVLAMIEHESGFDADAISDTDDYGLMQVNKVNHGWLKEKHNCDDMLNPYQNVFAGIKIISDCLKEYDYDYTKALMAYNMGDYGAKTALANGVWTTPYANRVLSLMQKYGEVTR
jgi:soluble lytic murein transglycosylase-like protein